MIKYVQGLVLVTLAVMAGAAAGQAQTWPQRPVKVLVPFAAGGNIDVMGRLAASRLSEAFGQQFVVENRVGGNGIIATEAVARSPADGNTLLWASTSVIAIFPAISKVGYDPVKDLAPISLFGVAPQVLIVNPKLPVQTVPEFVAYVKSQKEKLAYAGGGGPGSASNLLMSLFLKRAGLEMTSVSYRGTAPALTDLIAGHIPAMFVPISEALPQARAGHPHAGGVERHALARSAGSAEPRGAGLSRVPHGVVDRDDGAGRHAQGDHRSHGGGIRARASRTRNSSNSCRRPASSRPRMRARRRSRPSSPRRSCSGARRSRSPESRCSR